MSVLQNAAETAARSQREPLTHWIGGRGVVSPETTYRVGVDPATGGPGVGVPAGTAQDVDLAVRSADAAAWNWRKTASAERGRVLAAIAATLRARAEELADLEISDTGKPRRTALAEVIGAADYFEFYAGLVNLPHGEVIDVVPGQHVYTLREPFGVIGVITPWNLPINQAARAVAPALAAANTVVAKPAEVTSRTTLELARIATKQGLPDGVFNVVLGSGTVVGEALVRHPLVRKLAFTGSVGVGQSIGRLAADRVLPLTLELGGKSANVVFDDADLEFAATEAVRAFTTNAGQVCSAGTRLLVQSTIHDAFVDAVVSATRRLKVGTHLGPLITEGQFRTVQEYFHIARVEGATAATGGQVATGSGMGFYVEPTVYTGVTNDMRIAREEIFGPVLVVVPFETEDEAVALANDSDFGLVAGVWTQNVSRALRVAECLEVGQVFVNTWSTASVQTSFGGQKLSGYGREKGIEALNHYSQVKSVSIALR
ncbi:aldehyde dehydrogenase family protein [Kineococcus rhizosphaerae]|uniref:Aldehyde dehydrogenase (NAD+) n=1 Tax=Kineococcus rhizosphaerae TaxID=559628 RepID=A0A2T0QUT9_9ACTN|nr:aldehyde dehydrogenase family protein [Kineococcus rhizosphaerae]PRY08939.1 aldehyde dehydrogenase (NAD+) [Kineococcus rhizosphaerae]